MPAPQSPDQFLAHMQRLQEQAVLEVERATFWLFVLGVLSTLVFFWMLYWVIRWGVRDGMKDATARPWYRNDRRQVSRDREPGEIRLD